MQYIFISFLEVAYAYNWAIILELFWSTIIFHPDKSQQKFCRIIRIGTHSLKRRWAITFPLYLVQQNLMLRKFGAVRDWSSTLQAESTRTWLQRLEIGILSVSAHEYGDQLRVLCLLESAKTKQSLDDHSITAFYSVASYAMQHSEIQYRVA